MTTQQSVDIWLLTVVLILAGIGLVMVYSSSIYLSMDKVGSGTYYFKNQGIRLIIGLFAMILLTKLNYRGFAKIAPALLVIGFALLIMILIQKYLSGKEVHRWLNIGRYVFQPSEFAKVVIVMYLASAISDMGDKIRKFSRGLLPLLGVIGIAFCLVVLEPDFGIAGLMLVTGFYMLFIGRARLLHLVIVIAPAVMTLIFIVNRVEYMRHRLDIFINPEQGYQIQQSITSIGSGGLFGVGLGNSTMKYLFLPESHTDFVFSIFAEETGFIGTSVILVLTFILIIRGLKIAREAPDMFGFLLASGLIVMIGFQAFINIGVASALLPTTGMTLPFISYGGSSLLLSFCAIGILLNISKQGSYEKRLSREFGIRLHRRVLT